MVEKNNDEERLARIESMLERLQQEAADFRQTVTADLAAIILHTAPAVTARPITLRDRRKRRLPLTVAHTG